MSRLFALVSFLLSPVALSSVSDCSNGASLFHPISMSFSPDPTVPGENSTLLLSLKVPEELNNGTATYTTTYNFIPFAPTTDDLCGFTVPCPIQVGTLDTRSSYPIDPNLSGTMTIKVEWKDLTGRQLLCVFIKTTLGKATKQLTVVRGNKHEL